MRYKACLLYTSVCELVERYLETKTGVRHTTRAGYKTVINILKKEPFGQKKIKSIKLSDAKLFLIRMQEDGRRYSSIHSIRGVLRPAFQMAVDDEMLLRNPFEFQLATVPVSYTHLDVYKRQGYDVPCKGWHL